MTVRAKTYGDMLSAARRAAGLTQMEVAKRVGVGQSSYSKWENGESDMNAIYLRPLAKALGLTLEDVAPFSTVNQLFEDPSEKVGLLLVQRVAEAIGTGRLGPRQARIMMELLDELAPEPEPPGS